MEKKKILIAFGTRPEAIKMAPVYKTFVMNNDAETRLCVTAQHREMLDQVLNFFDIKPDYDLDLMKPNQNLSTITASIILSMKPVFEDFKPDYVLVHGDTTTSMAVALAGYYAGVKVAHVEAGLRTFDKWAPFPEEMNRSLTGRLADIHFAPTKTSKQNLLSENIPEKQILITGNTVIDALKFGIETIENKKINSVENLKIKYGHIEKMVLVTGHRRENFGDGFLNICKALKEIALSENVEIIYPVHLNPNVQKPVFELLDGVANIHLIDPQPYESFLWLMNKATLIITDSGGVQEEAPSLGKPVLVMRDTTERPEAVNAGTVILVGTNASEIVHQSHELLNNSTRYNTMSKLHNPYGDGNASRRILDFLIYNKINSYEL